MASETYQLVMRSGPTPGKVFPLNKGELTIGRESSNEVVINDAEISRKHSRLVQLPGGGYMIEDLGSTNGTFVNGQRLMGPHTLRSGELVMLGENISLNYEAAGGYDPDATVVAAPGPIRSEPIPPMPARPAMPEPPRYDAPSYQAPAYQQPSYEAPRYDAPQPGYPEPIPQGPAVYEAPLEGPRPSNRRTWLLAGCGCLLILCCVLGLAGYLFDSFNMYCTPPFNILFSCPPVP